MVKEEQKLSEKHCKAIAEGHKGSKNGSWKENREEVNTELFSCAFKCNKKMADYLRGIKNRSQYIKSLIEKDMEGK